MDKNKEQESIANSELMKHVGLHLIYSLLTNMSIGLVMKFMKKKLGMLMYFLCLKREDRKL